MATGGNGELLSLGCSQPGVARETLPRTFSLLRVQGAASIFWPLRLSKSMPSDAFTFSESPLDLSSGTL